MSKLKKTLKKRILAYVLTGAMIVSNMTSSNITAFASTPTDEEYQIKTSSVEIEEVSDEEEKIVEVTNKDEDGDTASSADGDTSSSQPSPAESTPEENAPTPNSSEAPNVQPSSTEAPDVQPSSTEAPDVQPSSTEAPSVQPSSSEEPNSEDASSEESSSEEASSGESVPDTTSQERTEWNFRSGSDLMGSDNGKQIQGAVETFAGLEIDASASGAKFDSTRTDWAQVNTGTKIKVPVKAASRVTVVGYGGPGTYAVDGTENTVAAQTEEDFYCAGTDGYVTIEMKADSYLGAIKVTRTEWSFHEGSDLMGSANGKKIQGAVETFAGLEIDASASSAKFDSTRTDWAQVNTGTKIKVPVKGASKVTVEGYGGAGTYAVDGTANTAAAQTAETFECAGTDGYATIEMKANSYLGSIKVEPSTGGDGGDSDDTSPRVKGKNVDGKPDVWDFAAGAIELDDNDMPIKYIDTEVYNNMLTEDIMNTWYGTDSGLKPGDVGANLSSFEVKDEEGNVLLEFNGNGKSNHRIRSKNAKITRNDVSTKKVKVGEDEEGNDIYEEYLGYVYSNSASEPKVYLGILLDEGDIVTAVVGSNGGASLLNFESMDDADIPVQSYEFKPEDGPNASITAFYAPKAGKYKIYSVNEKLVVARLTVEKTDSVTVSGKVTAPESLTKDYGIMFTCRESGAAKVAPVVNGEYTIDLNEKYTYDVSLSDANGYVVGNDERFFTLEGEDIQETNGKKTYTYDVQVKAVDLVTVTGSIKGLTDDVAGRPAKHLENLKLTFESDKIYIPELTVDTETGAFTLVLEQGVEYTVKAKGVDDFALSTTTISATENKTADIEFTAKPVYKITINPDGVTKDTLANTSFIFSRVYAENNVKAYEEDYVYTFTGTEGIQLRDGQYEIKVGADCPYEMYVTSDLKVEGKDIEKVLRFDPNPKTSWDFRTGDYTGQTSFGGLTITGGKYHSTNYGMSIGGTDASVEIPVTGACDIVVSVGYNWDVTIGDTNYKDNTNSGDKDVTFKYTGAAGTVKLVAGSEFTSYIKKIEVKYAASKDEYKETITVGAKDCDYTTINDALDAVRNMDRTSSQRVTIVIQPGDYEEMLVIDTPNVTLKNANANPSITPINKGVDIAASSVRITSYYGHGYAYYSMGSDCKWNADILAVNKENGYLSFENPGTGTTSGSYWNATVVINASGIEADGIIFENSFNQYVSKKAADDIIVPLAGAKGESLGARNAMKVGSTQVQYKDYVERAAALAIYNNCSQISFNNCSFIGRQDTLYGGTGTTAAFYDCDIYGGTDYIFGGMTAVFAKCGLLFNTNDQTSNAKNDVGYITAPQQSSGRGYLMYNCTVTSTTPGINTASAKTSKPGYFGRPWTAGTSEALFYKTIIETTNYNGKEESLIVAAGWLDTLSGKSPLSQEYASIELAKVDNLAERADWSNVLTADENGEVTLADGNTKVTDSTVVKAFLGNWNPFTGKDMTLAEPEPGSGESNRVDPGKTTVDSKNQRVSLDSDKIEVKAANLAAKGNKQQWKIVVTYKPNEDAEKQELTEGIHYNVLLLDGSNGTSGTQKFCVEGTGVHTDLGTFVGKSKEDTYELVTGANSANDITKKITGLNADAKNATYTGTYITPGLGWKETVDKNNYEIVYKNNVNAGKASVTVIGRNDYYGSKTYTFTIKPANITTTDITSSNLTVTPAGKKYTVTAKNADAIYYTGDPVYFENISLKLGSLPLEEGSDYTITYKNNAKVGKASATIKASNNFTGSIKLDYEIKRTEIATSDIESLENVSAEYTIKKGPQVLEIAIPKKGVTLKAGTDFKADYSAIKNAIKNGEMTPDKTADITIKGAGAYKDLGSVTLHIQVVKGDFHIKSGVTIDQAAITKAGGDVKKLIAATKITDASGTKPTDKEIAGIKTDAETVTISLTNDAKANFNATKISCHVATKLSSVAKQKKANKLSTNQHERQEIKFDGVNQVTLTSQIIAQYYLEQKNSSAPIVTADDIEIVSYKNNHKLGSATVTIKGKDNSPYYGTMNVKFKIVTETKPTLGTGKSEGSSSTESEEGSGSTEGSDVSGSSEEGPGATESSDVPGSSEEESEPDPSEIHTVYLVGDSTVCSFTDDYYYPRYGYGTQIGNYLDKYYKVNNLALSGRSSKSFLTENNYKTLTDSIKEGDVLVIGFGHNDEKNEADRYTNPNDDYQTDGSFAKSLYDNYVKVAQGKGAQVILCTPIVRRSTSDTLSNSNCHITSDATDTAGNNYPGGDYPEAIRKLGKDVNVPVVDLTAATKTLYESLGANETLYLHAWTSNKEGSVDNTHINIYGAKWVAYLFAKELKEKYAETLDIAGHVRNLDTEPSKDKDLVSNSEYKEPTYDSNLKQSELWSDYGIFKGTVFGDVGGAVSTDNFSLGEDSDKNMHIIAGVKGAKGKIAVGSDGIAMYYYKVPVGKKFSFSATAKINSFTANNQVAFGLMARDDMYIDLNDGSVNSDYVAAGSFTDGAGTNCFYRKSGALNKGAALTVETLKAENTYDLSIVFNGEGYTCTFGNEQAQSGGYDFLLTSKDSEYQYIGMFASRQADISFSDIKLVVDGKNIDIMTGEETSEPEEKPSEESSEGSSEQSSEGSSEQSSEGSSEANSESSSEQSSEGSSEESSEGSSEQSSEGSSEPTSEGSSEENQENTANTYAAPKTTVIQWFKNLFSDLLN